MRYAVVGTIQELYFVEADSQEEAINEVENRDSEWLRPVAWETTSVRAYQEDQIDGHVMPRPASCGCTDPYCKCRD